MIYYLHEFLIQNLTDFNGYNLISSQSFRAAGSAITALIFSFLIGPKIIRTLVSHNFSETIRKNGPESHQTKKGTPTMGGIIIILSIILPTILWAKLDNLFIITILVSTIWMAIIGYIDDYLKIKNYKKGLIARYKLLGQFILGIFIYYMIFNSNINYYIVNLDNTLQNIPKSSISIPFIANGFFDLNIFYIPLILIIITATSNAVNLTDGLDGLATGLTAISTLVFGAIAYASGRIDFSNYLNIIYIPQIGELFIFSLSLIGACIGFLWFNAHPAKIFMGDVGSLSLGSALGTLAILLKKEILLIIIGGIFVIESASVIIQVLYFKYTKIKTGTGKRFFKMAPLHHHLELSGWPETHVVIRLWIIGVILALFSLTTFKIQ
ncbi:MAG: phospho-N-acetylmuramoyl-pentapeptide-transferase [Candidatus Marinimicrobia bacterium]|nr:phospho-N-acetylmuramoyl-pentapeptide-transferase [Candidatus Neomarinimicrobiota bacterium]|tara:strand:- start:5424 stop:6566 length:1143 start_codon:yes stop_codon:yes gene_type:complete